MRGVLFATDHIFLRGVDRIYSNTLSYDILRRYVDSFGKVIVVARVEDCVDIGNLSVASGDGVEFVFLDSISNVKSFFGLRRDYRDYIRDLIASCDMVIVRLPSHLGLLVADIARERGVGYLVELVGCARDALWYYGGIKARLYSMVFFMQTRLCVSRADYVIYVTQEFLQRRYPANPNSYSVAISDVDVLDVVEDKVLNHNHIIFGSIAFLDMRYKGIDMAIKALSKLDGVSFEYHILGAGSIDKYQKLSDKLGIGDRVFFDGVLSHDEVFDWLDSVDLYIHPSLVEGLSRAIIEAMSRACVVVSSSVGGVDELLDSDMLFNPSHIIGLKEKIELLLSDRDKMIDCAKSNVQRVKSYQKLSLDRKRESFYNQIIESQNSKMQS